MQCQIFLIGVFCLSQCSPLILAMNSNEKLRMKFFRAEPSSPEDTLATIKRLRDYYSKSTDPIDKNDFIRMSNLIEASNISPEKCSIESLSKAKWRVDNWVGFHGNVAPYLRHYLREQFLTCKDNLEDQLKDQLGNIDGHAALAINKLRVEIAKTNPEYGEKDRYTYLTSTGIEQGLASYLREIIGHNLDKVVEDEQLFALEFDNSIIKLCYEVNNNLQQSMSVLNLFEDNSNIMDSMSLDTVKWIENNRICKIISSRKKKYSRITLHELKYPRSRHDLAEVKLRLLCEFEENLKDKLNLRDPFTQRVFSHRQKVKSKCI